ncbi:Hypothetical protein PHPALM_228 [Phytophthora palmivora]|uniref:Tyrosinase copper-binding domain-containing protein n=1 Tax=Phytophthora palmivora TaxID=4796 RepID=A0A2P4YVH0_9STRA|nr:Hypothetical protein PHPALM_228 [Phytophthora palmivora]
MKLLRLFVVLVLALTLTLSDAQASCGPRIRRNWDAMSNAEKATYKGALAAAMDSGAYIKFVEIHTEMMSEMEAHKQCINKALTGECKTLGDCSPILKELGGFSSSSRKTVVINGKNVTGICVAEAPLNHFCQSSSATGATCAGCLPRGKWGSAQIPASLSYASVIGQVFNGANIEKVSRTVERGCHTDIHATLGSTMAKYQSPADPIFWSHHAMLDALLTIFHKCRVGTRRMTFEEKATDPVAWASCKRRVGKQATGEPFKPTDIVTMRTGEKGSNPIEGSKDPLIGQYFEGIPNRFADLMDGSDLGIGSYTYEINGLLATMYNSCGGLSIKSHNTRAPPAISPSTFVPESPTVTPTTTAPETSNDRSQGEQIHGVHSVFDWLFSQTMPKRSTPRRRLSGCRTATKKTTEKIMLPSRSHRDTTPVVIAASLTRSEKRVMNWYHETMTSNGGYSVKNIADMERQVCMFQDQCLGGIMDYTEEFKSLWGVQESRCRTITNDIHRGEQEIIDSAWKEKMKAHFGCPHPINETIVSDGIKQSL